MTKLDGVSDQNLGPLATHILDVAHQRIGYNVAGLHFMLATFAKTRPADLRTFLQVVLEECA